MGWRGGWLWAAALVALPGTIAALDAGSGATVTQPPSRLDRHPRSVSVVAVGDWLPEARVNRAAAGFASPGVRYDHAPLLAPINALIGSADLAICHVETPIDWPGETPGLVGRSPAGYSLIAAPWELAGDLRRIGFDRCSTASNHSWDLGPGGIDSTLAALDTAGISHDGTARSEAEAAFDPAVDVIHVGGVGVAHVSFTDYSNTGFPSAAWRLRRASSADPVVAATGAARRGGAELVIVSIHVIAELADAPTATDRAVVQAIVERARPDLIVIHGPHAVQPLEQVAGVPVFWSLGNLVSGMGVAGRDQFSDPRTLDGVVAAVRFTEVGGTWTVEAAPVLICQMADTRVVYPGLSASAVPVPPEAADQIGRCVSRSRRVVADLV